jgi:hypothetical protein
MFLTAGLYRSTSALSLMKVADLPQHEPDDNPPGFQISLRTGVSRNFRHFLLFSSLINPAMLISGHFFVITYFRISNSHIRNIEPGSRPVLSANF